MAHGFIKRGADTTFASRKELAWHKLGKTVDAMTSKEAIVLGGMDFEVALAPVYLGVKDVSSTEVKDNNIAIKHTEKGKVSYMKGKHIKTNFGTFRTDTLQPFGIVGQRYEPIQNIEAFDFFDEIIGQGHAKYETVGALGNGEKVFLTAKIPSTMLVGKEHIDKYLLLTMAHDGTGSVQIMFTPIRVVCNNTLSAAIGSATNKVSIRHTKNARARIEASKEILGIVQHNGIKLEEVFNRMTEVKINDQQMGERIINSFGLTPMPEDEQSVKKALAAGIKVSPKFSTQTSNKFNDIMKYYEIGVGQELIKGTAWGAYNAIVGYQQNVQKYRDSDVQFESIFNKGGSTVRQKAFNELVQIIR